MGFAFMKRGSWSWKFKRRQPAVCQCGDHAWVPLTKGFVTLVDTGDIGALAQFNWSVTGTRALLYARRGTRDRAGVNHTVFLHRTLMDEPDGLLVDHEDGNGLDNRRSNLRVATPSQNMANSKKKKRASTTSDFKGVHWSQKDRRWVASIRKNGKTAYLGSFDTPLRAHAAYVAAAKETYGPFARAA